MTYQSLTTELYDYLMDPDELNNVAGEPDHQKLQQRLTETMLEDMAALAVMDTARRPRPDSCERR